MRPAALTNWGVACQSVIAPGAPPGKGTRNRSVGPELLETRVEAAFGEVQGVQKERAISPGHRY